MPSRVFEGLVLLHRVLIKLWNEGDHDFVSGSLEKNGKVYPLYRDVVYVTWRESKRPDGTIQRRIGRFLSAYNEAIFEQLQNDEIPEGVKLVEYHSAGIDPHEFLSK